MWGLFFKNFLVWFKHYFQLPHCHVCFLREILLQYITLDHFKSEKKRDARVYFDKYSSDAQNRHLPVRVSIGTWWCWWLLPSFLATLWWWFGSWSFPSLGWVFIKPGGCPRTVVVLKHHWHRWRCFAAGWGSRLGALFIWKTDHRIPNTFNRWKLKNCNISANHFFPFWCTCGFSTECSSLTSFHSSTGRSSNFQQEEA